MKKMTDRELTDRISQVFDKFEDPSAEYGWQQLRKKYPENNRRPVLLWLGAAAAVLLAVCGLLLTIPDAYQTDQNLANGKHREQPTQENKSNSNAPLQVEEKSNLPDGAAVDLPGALAAKQESGSSNYTKFKEPVRHQSTAEDRIFALTPADIVRDQVQVLDSTSSHSLSANDEIHKKPLVLLPETKPVTETKHSGDLNDALIDAAAKMLALAQPESAPDKTAQGQEGSHASKKKDNNLDFSFFAGSYFNYSLGSETKINFGGGFTSDIKLSNNLKLSTGLALSNNSLTYNNGVPSSGKENLVYYSVPSYGTQYSNNNLTTITKYDANLLVLDIPINLKYLLIPKDNKLYMLAGLSSGTYLSEMYSLNYRNYSTAGTYINQAQGAEVKKQLQAFDFARTLNISFGYSTNLGKTQNISIEPFLKYPLGGLGSEDLKFGSTGVNLKLNFSQSKKR